MKSIELTQEQKDKLLEMCVNLFPDIKWEHYDTANITEKKEYPEVWVVQYTDEEGELFCIPWFEFVIMFLVESIQVHLTEDLLWRNQPEYVRNVYKWDETRQWTMYTEFFFHYPKRIHRENPVDYLYNEFKKITWK